jgi:hypothetical protein
MATNFDQYIVEYIQTSYKRAIEKIAQQIWQFYATIEHQ